MIIGNGMIAQAIRKIDDPDYIFFCSGVSNSAETSEFEYDRERTLLERYCKSKKCLIYFSSYFVNFSEDFDQRYYKHKKQMETLIAEKCCRYKIFRLPQVVGLSKNPNTLTNFFYEKIANNKKINVYTNARRNLVDVDDVVKIVHYINNECLFVNERANLIALKNYRVFDVVKSLEFLMHKKANVHLINNDEKHLELPVSLEMEKIYNLLGIQFDCDYLDQLLKKYYTRKI